MLLGCYRPGCNQRQAGAGYVLKAAEKLSFDAESCVVVEDAIQGVEAGKAAGMPVVAVTTTRSRADLQRADIIVDSLAQLQARQFVELITNRNR